MIDMPKLFEKYRSEHPDVDWNQHTVYVITDIDTGKVTRIGHALKDRIIGQFGGQEIDR